MEPRRPAPPAAAAAATAVFPPSPSPPPPHLHQAPRALLPLPSAHAPSKKRRVSPSPRKAAATPTTPAPPRPRPPALATSAPAAAFLNPYSLPQAQGGTSTEPAYVDAATALPRATDEKPSTAPGPPPTASEEPSTPPAAREARKIEKKVVIRIPAVPEGALAAGKATAAVGALPVGEGCAPDKSSSQRNAALDEEVDVERNVREMEADKVARGCNAVDVDEARLGEEAGGGGTLIRKLVADTDSDVWEAEELVIGKDEFGMADRAGRQRRMTELFVCGLGNDMKEEDVRSVFGWAGEITEVRMAMDARTSKSKGYCFVRYRDPSQAKKVVAEFCKLKICWKLCQIEALDGNDKIILENIDKKWKKEDIMKLLHKTGVEKIVTVTLMADCDNPGYNCGYAFLKLETERDAWMAYIKLSRKGVFSSCLNITVAWAKPMSDPDEKMQQVKERDDFLQATQGILLQAQEHAKPYYNIKHTAMAFSVGDWVWVKLLLRPMVSMPFHNKGKGLRFYGPYQVLERIGETTYRLQLQAGARIHDVFHVDFLERFSGTVLATASSLPPMLHGNMLSVPVSILRSRLARGQWQVLVRWEGLAASEASWEDVETFRQRYPTFVIDDQLFLKGSDVMIGIKYHRRQHG